MRQAARSHSLGGLLVPDVADPLEEEQRQDVALPVGAIDRRATQDVGGFPEVGSDLLQVESDPALPELAPLR